MELTPPTPPPTPPPSGGRPSAVPARVARSRALVRRSSSDHAALLREVAAMVREGLDDVPSSFRTVDRAVDVEALAFDLVATEVSVGLGISGAAAASLVSLAWRLDRVLPNVLTALSSGLLDPARAKVLSRGTESLDDETARAVAGRLLAETVAQSVPDPGPDGMPGPAGPWDGPSPRAWNQRIDRAVVRADPTAAERRHKAAVAARRVRAWAEGDGTGVLQVRADAADVALADQVITDLAMAWPRADADGVLLTMDQRRSDAFMNVVHSIRAGCLDAGSAGEDGDAGPVFAPPSSRSATSAFGTGGATGSRGSTADLEGALPRVRVQRSHDLGLVLHADTLFGDGPAADECAELRGLGAPAAVDPTSARTLARAELGRGSSVQVVVVDASGALAHVIRLTHGVATACRDRKSLLAAVREALPRQPELATGSYVPTAAITRYVHAAAPTCSFYDCPRLARRSDLDHDTPYPRGPTGVTNLDPKCHRHHDQKTKQLVRTRLTAGPGQGQRSVTWTLRNGLRVTTSPEPLPGCESPRSTVPPA